MNFLLDTCLISEFTKKHPNTNVVKWFEEQLEESLFISVLTIGEIRKGITQSKDSKRRNVLENWLEKVLLRFGERILPITVSIASRWGKLKGDFEKKGRTLTVVDSLIAATALEHNLIVATRNIKDFTLTGVKIRNVWQG